eukprot:1230236-Rhodomonas_salina.1
MDQPGNTTELFEIAGAADPLFVTTPPGYYANSTHICVPCPEDFYCRPPYPNAPQECPRFSKAPMRSDSFYDCSCDPGFYVEGPQCEQCPADFWCGGQDAFPDIVPCPEQTNSDVGSFRPWQCIGQFDFKLISQNNPFYSCEGLVEINTLELRLRSPANIASHVQELASVPATTITVTGLGGVGQAGGLVVVRGEREGDGAGVTFCENNQLETGLWQGVDVNQSLVLTMCRNQRFEADSTYAITFNITNPQLVQESPSVSISVKGSVGFPLVDMEKPGPGTELFGIAGAADPLFVTTPPGHLSLRNDICVPCQGDTWCPGDNVSNACPAFSYGTHPRIAQTDCLCNVGYFGDPGGPCQLCPAGDYCPPGARNSTPCPDPRISAAGSWEPWQCEGRLDDKMISQ